MVHSTNITPLEANPEVFTEYASALGRPDLVFQDLYAFEDWAYEMLHQPVVGLMVVVPLTPRVTQWRDYNYLCNERKEPSPKVWFTSQNIPNTCGTVALLHLINNVAIGLPGAKKELKAGMQLINTVEQDDVAMEKLHTARQSKGETHSSPRGVMVDTHFITFVLVEGDLYELDGQLPSPVNHGPATEENFLTRVGDVIQKNFVAIDPTDLRFSAIAASRSDSKESQ